MHSNACAEPFLAGDQIVVPVTVDGVVVRVKSSYRGVWGGMEAYGSNRLARAIELAMPFATARTMQLEPLYKTIDAMRERRRMRGRS